MKALRTIGLATLLLTGLAACDREEILEGERLDLRAPFGTATETPANRALPLSLAAPSANADWLSPIATDGQHAALSAAPSRVWTAPIGAGESRRHRITAAPVVADGRVFTLDSRALVTAVSTQGGEVLWTRDIRPANARPDAASGGGLAAAGGRVFVASAFGVLTALDASSGAPVWSHRFEAPLTGTPLVTGDRVVVVATNGLAAALDTATGRIDWTVRGLPAPALVMGGPRPAVAGNTVLLPFPSGELQAVERVGARRLWTTHVAGTRLARAYSSVPGISADPMVSGNRVYAGNATGRFSAFDLATGRVAWTAPEGAMDAAWMAGGSLFFVSDANTLVRLDARSGERIWAVDLPNYTRDRERSRAEVFAHYGPVLAGGRLVVVSNDGRMRSFDPVSGALLAETELPGRAASRPAIAGGTLFVATTDGRLHALR